MVSKINGTVLLALILAEMTVTSIEEMSEWGEEEWKELSRQLKEEIKREEAFMTI